MNTHNPIFFKDFSPTLEVSGLSILSAISALKKITIPMGDYLANYGIIEVKVNGWYNGQAWLDCLKMIFTKYEPHTLFALEKGIGSAIPDQKLTLEKILVLSDERIKMIHR